MIAIGLTCEYMKNPLGLDIDHPRLQWRLEGGNRQTAFEVRTVKNGKEGWNSGKREGAQMSVSYEPDLTSRDQVIWQVRVWDEKDQAGAWSEWARFEAGLLHPEDWTAKWICGVDTATAKRLPADCYRKTFSLKKDLDHARLYATALGVYEADINGKKCGDAVFSPGCTEYEKRLYYQTYDVTDLIEKEIGKEQQLTFVVGDGWYKGKIGSDNTECFFGNQTQLLAQMELFYRDGSREIIATGESFSWCNDGPIRYADLKDGIVYDFNRMPSYGRMAEAAEGTSVPLTSADNLSVTEHEHFSPELLRTPSGKQVLDFGQNFSGYIICRFHGKKGQKVTLSLGEVLDNGEFTNANFFDVYGHGEGKTVSQQMKFTLSGANDVCHPKFFYSGFQYALVEGMEDVNPKDFTGVAVYTDLIYGGAFACSDEKINRFVENTLWSQKSNFVDVPTDCPTREKSAWTGDAQVFVKTALYFADGAAFYRKWLRDVRDCQREDGRVDNVCPKIRGIQPRDALEGSVGWGDAAVIIPYTLWKMYGDESFIRDNLDLMLGWMKYMIKAAGDKSLYHLPEGHPLKKMVEPYLLPDSPYNQYIIETGLHWGEWMEPKDVYSVPTEIDLIRPKQEETTAYMHYSMGLLREMLTAIGREDEASVCREYAEGAKKAYHAHFVKDGNIDSDRPCKLVRPLAFGLLEEDEAKRAAARLNELCVKRDYRIGTGFLSTPYILPALARYGYLDTAYRMLENRAEPGWLAMVEQGATTVWESYNGYDENGHPLQISFNHYSPGAVCSFLFTHVCGISIAGERRFVIRPLPGGALDWAQASFDSAFGKVFSKWEKDGENYRYEIRIPPNCTASIILPDGACHEVKAGTYRFSL